MKVLTKNPIQFKIIAQEAEKKTIEAHPNLKEWFNDIAATSKKLTEFENQCRALTGVKQKYIDPLHSNTTLQTI